MQDDVISSLSVINHKTIIIRDKNRIEQIGVYLVIPALKYDTNETCIKLS